MNKSYDRLAVGDRLRENRTLVGLTQDEIADKIMRAPKYYANIERGSCGMSMETMLALADFFHVSLDYLIYGISTKEEAAIQQNEERIVLHMLNSLPEKQRAYALEMLKNFIAACSI